MPDPRLRVSRYDNRESHGKALGLHHSKMTGREINVELTVGGGGKKEGASKEGRPGAIEGASSRRK